MKDQKARQKYLQTFVFPYLMSACVLHGWYPICITPGCKHTGPRTCQAKFDLRVSPSYPGSQYSSQYSAFAHLAGYGLYCLLACRTRQLTRLSSMPGRGAIESRRPELREFLAVYTSRRYHSFSHRQHEWYLVPTLSTYSCPDQLRTALNKRATYPSRSPIFAT
jgi:hypothetical protein